MNLKLHNRDEVFLVKLDSALYFKAEDHYTCVYYGRDTKQLLPFGLAHIEDALELCDADYMRFGRSHIINLQKVVHVSATKEMVTLLTSENNFLQIHIARTAIREIMAHLKDERPCEEGNIAGGEFLNNIEDEEVYVLLSKPHSPNKPKVRTLQCFLLGCAEESGLLFYYIAKGCV